jgi:uncharacterized membrane protein YgcG
MTDKTSDQIVVATVPSLAGHEHRGFMPTSCSATGSWGRPRPTTVFLLLVAPNERKVRIEVGYGLEGTLTDATASMIIQAADCAKIQAGRLRRRAGGGCGGHHLHPSGRRRVAGAGQAAQQLLQRLFRSIDPDAAGHHRLHLSAGRCPDPLWRWHHAPAARWAVDGFARRIRRWLRRRIEQFGRRLFGRGGSSGGGGASGSW